MGQKTPEEVETEEFLKIVHAAGKKAAKEMERDPEYIKYHTQLVDVCNVITVLRIFPELHGDLWTRAEALYFKHKHFDLIYLTAARKIRQEGWSFEEFQSRMRNYPSQ